MAEENKKTGFPGDGSKKKEAKAVVVENADLQLCNLIHRGMSMKEAKAKLGIK